MSEATVPMFIVLLRFSDNRASASQFAKGHNQWIQRGFEDGVFLVVGALQASAGGGIVAHHLSRSDLEARVRDDPFVAARIVTAEILELAPSKVDARLSFLLGCES